jgi:tetratricopeptide (TPR) repeat protein
VFRFAGPAASVALGIAFAAVAFGAKGGSELSRITPAEIALVLTGGLIVAAAVLYGRRGPLHGATALVLFAALAALTALSIEWSVAPDLSWIEANRTFAYLLVFAAALAAARLAPRAAPVLLGGLLIAAAAIVGYALLSRVWPGSLAENEIYARIGQPFDYWNAVGLTAALAVPPALWLGTRRSGNPLASALAFPLLGMLIVTLVLTASRGSVAAALAGALIWLVAVPLRLRSATLLLTAGAGAAPVIAWALSKDAFTEDRVAVAVRESVGTELGLLVLLMAAGLLAVGLTLRFGEHRLIASIRLRRRLGIAVLAVACAAPMLALGSAVLGDRDLSDTISNRVDELTSETARTPGDPSRLTAASSSRSQYWREAADVFEDRPDIGTGAGTFGVARLRYRDKGLGSRHAHGYVPQTLADLGLAGLGTTLALAVAWLVAAVRATDLYPRIRPGRRRRERPPWDGERVAAVAVALAALVFGLQSAIDWTWFVPAPAVMALAAAGFVAGRGPTGATADEPTASLAAVETGEPPWALAGGGGNWPPRRPARPRLVLAGGVLTCALLFAWAAWQPERAERAGDRSLRLLEDGRVQAASEEADSAHDINPLSPQPLFLKAAAEEAAGRKQSALATLERAVVDYPSNPQVWLRLADFQLDSLDRPQAALRTLRGALYLDPHSSAAQRTFEQARARLRSNDET